MESADFRRSASIILFFKDIFFLIGFGFIAISAAHAASFPDFIEKCGRFVWLSLVWSLSDPFFRQIWEPAALSQEPLWRLWAVIDTAQLVITLFILNFIADEYAAAVMLAVFYIIFFGFDLAVILRVAARRPSAVESGGNRAIYLAGPLFSAAERSFNLHLANALRDKGHEVFVPQEHEHPDTPPDQIFARDVGAMDRCRLLVANMDGADPDSGTCWECGYAFAHKWPVIAFRTDFRINEQAGKPPYNPMLTQSADLTILRPFASPEDIAREIIEALSAL